MFEYQVFVQVYVPAKYDHSIEGYVDFIPITHVRAPNEESALSAAKLKTDRTPLAVENIPY